jgi:selenocysteine lyase/cysteine desulfurase
MQRRTFLQNFIMTSAVMGLSTPGWSENLLQSSQEWSDHLIDTDDDDFWRLISKEFTTSPNIINLNNGGVSPQPKSVQDAHIRFYQYANEAPSYYMWRILDQGRESLRTELANLTGCHPDSIAINRNSTEGLNTIIFGLDLERGDEIVLNAYDYPNMMNAWKQREKRDGIKLIWIDIPIPCNDKKTLIDAYVSAFTPSTKLVHLTHVINWNGQVIPVREIAREAKSRGIEVLVDAAHSFAQLDFSINDLECDYMATSLHKWLCAPFGSGMLYIQPEKISKIWALLSSDEPNGPDIRKFESLGTRSFASEMAIGAAIDFHQIIGQPRKEKRLKYLRNYWMEKVTHLKKVVLYSPAEDDLSCALGVFGIEGMNASQIENHLFKHYGIHCVAIEYKAINGVRITPNVYTLEHDLDRLVNAIKTLAF